MYFLHLNKCHKNCRALQPQTFFDFFLEDLRAVQKQMNLTSLQYFHTQGMSFRDYKHPSMKPGTPLDPACTTAIYRALAAFLGRAMLHSQYSSFTNTLQFILLLSISLLYIIDILLCVCKWCIKDYMYLFMLM